jgi:thymidylate synthase
MKEYLDLLSHALALGTVKKNRTGVDTLSLFNYNYKVDVQKGFPLLTTKKIGWKNILFENLWFLSGDCSNKFFEKHGIKFWKPWEDENGNLPEAYGKYWREFEYVNWGQHVFSSVTVGYFDQFSWIISELKKNPNNRRLCLTNWYPPNAHNAKLPPCHCFAVFNVQYTNDGTPELNLHMTQRSCDIPVGVPFNLAGYGFLLELFAHLSGLRPKYFGHTLVDAHIYANQLEGVVKQLEREPMDLPKLYISEDIKTLKDLDELIRDGSTDDIMGKFPLVGYQSHPFIKFPVAV